MNKKTIMMLSSFAVILVIYIVSYIVVYEPLETRLEIEIDQNFVLHVENAQTVANTYLDNLSNSSTSVSNRVMIKNKIVEYNDGFIDFSELKTFTEGYYTQSTVDVHDLIDSARIVDDMYLINFNDPVFEDYVTEYHHLDTDLTMDLINLDGTDLIIACSPIVLDGTVLGHDMLIYDITDFLESLVLENYTFVFEKLEGDYEIEKLIYEDKHVEYHVEVSYLEEVLVGEIDYAVLREPTIQLSRNSIVFTAIIISIAFAVMYFVIMQTYDKLIIRIKSDSNKFEELAKKDTLTNAWNRSYFIDWIEKYALQTEQKSAIVMLDIDKFKFINDTYGHHVGDDVLITLVNVISNNLRTTDVIARQEEDNYVARFGGDEFIIFLPNCNVENAGKVMRKIEKSLKSVSEFDFVISISYGIVSYCRECDVEEALKEADELMYKMKNKVK